MGAIKHLFQATRDVIGGAFGGLVAAWVLTDIDQRAVILLAVGTVVGVAIIYSIFEWMQAQEEDALSETAQESPSDVELRQSQSYWPPHRAS